VLDIKLRHAPCHAAMLPVAIVPNCAATRYMTFELDGSGVACLPVHDDSLWEDIPDTVNVAESVAVNLDTLTKEEVRSWRAGDMLLLSGKMLTARDAAHKRIANLLNHNQPLPVSLSGRAVYYVGPVDATGDEVVGPAGPTTSNRMDAYLEDFIEKAGLLISIGKAERSRHAIDAIKKTGTAYLSAVGGAAYLISKTITHSRVVAFEDLGMEAIYEFEVRDFPATVAIDSTGDYIHKGVVPIIPMIQE
jgi:fumarate hydratase class I